ncbi:glycosyl hydrolase [Streptomyces sp. NPDC051940]|uniref:glycoside hydrolase family 26 protein n=1 Tax=Streptomyces sp. NPDC051940 TaxID=3155675 RepID=UPI003438BAAF
MAIAVAGIMGSLFLWHPSPAEPPTPSSVGADVLADAVPDRTTATEGSPGAQAKPDLPKASDFIHPSSGKYLGVSLPNGAAGLSAYNKKTRTPANLSLEFVDFGERPPVGHMRDAYEQHALTVLNWQPMEASIASIVAGDQDAYISAFAADLAQTGLPVGVVFASEFNTDWQPWGTQATSAEQYVAAWRRIHNLATAAGATNVIWIWAPNVINPVRKTPLKPFWPGEKYVDWVGLAAYWTPNLQEDSWETLIVPTKKRIRTFTDLPIVITETGVMQGPRKIEWIRAMFEGLATDRDVLGMIYLHAGFAEGKRGEWKVTKNPEHLAAWRAGAKKIETVPVNK